MASLLPYIALGFVSLLLQITLMREYITVFSGNELDIGITLSLWLVSVGLGSLAGSKIQLRNAFGFSFLLVALLAGPTLLGIMFIRPALSLEYGETASLGATFLSTALTIFPLCFSLGLQFPTAVARMENTRQGPGSPASFVYGLEAAGAFMGGILFTFVLSGRVGPEEIVLALALMYVLAGTILINRRSLLLTALLPIALYATMLHLEGTHFQGGKVVVRTQSRYGEIMLTSMDEQLTLYGSGHFLFTYPDPQVDEFGVHLPMSVYPVPEGPDSVLAVGGSPGRLVEFLKYPLKRLDFVEMDPVLLKTSLEMLDGNDSQVLDDERLRIILNDGRRHVKSVQGPEYDLIILSLAEPSTANMNRFYTSEFFVEAKAALKTDGMLSLSLPTSAGYVSRRMKLANGSIYNSLRSVFGNVEVSTEQYGLYFASESPIDTAPERLVNRFSGREITTTHFHPYLIKDAFSSLRARLHRKRLGEVSEANTDLRPSAYLYNLMLWAEIHGGMALNALMGLRGYNVMVLFAAFAAAALAVRKNRKRTLYYSIFTTGYAAMAFMLAVTLGYQAMYGYVYEMFGLLSAVFMVGVSLGAFAVRRIGLKGLLLFELGTAVFAASSPLFFGPEILFYMFSIVAGAITGCQFGVVSLSMKTDSASEAGGKLYCFDLAGSFVGAMLSAIILIPIVGVRESLFVVSGLKLMSALLVFNVRK
jgi:spermidine synthase